MSTATFALLVVVLSSIGDDEARARIDHMVGGEAW